MKKVHPLLRVWLVLLGLAVLTGCATTPKIDWASRVGNYTYDEAVADYGPPDKQATLGNGNLVVEWLTARGYRELYPVGPTYYGPGGYGRWYPPTYVDTSTPDNYIRMVFDADKKLLSAKAFNK